MKIGTRQRITAICAILVLTAFFLALYWYVCMFQERSSSARVRAMARYTAAAVDGWMAGYEEEIRFLAGLSRAALEEGTVIFLLEDAGAQKLLPLELVLSTEAGDLLLFDRDGGKAPAPDLPAPARWIEALSATPAGAAVSGPFPSLQGKGRTLLVSHGLNNRDGKRMGTVALCVPLATLAEKAGCLYAANVGELRYYLVDAQGNLLFSHLGEGNPDGIADHPELRELPDLAVQNGPALPRMEHEGDEHLVAGAALAHNGWRVYLLSPTRVEFCTLPLLGVVFGVTWLGMCALVLCLLAMTWRKGHFEELSELDHLTGCGNRLGFEKTLAEVGKREAFPVCLLVMDVDGLKLINDSLGHEAGDALLRRVALLLQRSLREHDVVYRIGGDEFAVIIPEMEYDVARQLADRITIEAAQLREKTSLPPVYISHGLAVAGDAASFACLFTRADEAMYQDKELRREAAGRAIRQWIELSSDHKDRRRACREE